MEREIKPKLVFFQWQHKDIPEYLRLHLQEHVKCLSEFFEVIVISEDSDYQKVCDKHQPDLVLFESGAYAANGGKREIKNTSAHSEIPKLGFLHADAYCMSREAIISDFERWGVQTFFTLCVSMAEYTPEIAENLFVWPNFVDSDLYQDYGESKIVPVLLTGSQATHYPWRNRISRIVTQYYPSLTCPHFGWQSQRAASRMIYGERYARMLNASWFVPTCGTIAKEVVRKHFEIPASRSCLVTEKTPALEAAGFVDMQNCVFADEKDVLDKLDYLFQNPDKLENIISTGYKLVHSRHTLKQRDQIFQWFNLYKNLKPGQRIVQTDPFKPLITVDRLSEIKNSHVTGNGLDRILLHKGDEKLWTGKYDEAEALYLRCLNYHAYVPEPKLRLALCNLYKGNAELAVYWILQPIKATLEEYQAFDPDPVEWAYFIISLLCQGQLDEAIKSANQFPSLFHPELERTRWAINALKNKENKEVPLLPRAQPKYRYTLHQMPNRGFNEWVSELGTMLRACGQQNLAEMIISAVIRKHQLSTQAGIALVKEVNLFREGKKVVERISLRLRVETHKIYNNQIKIKISQVISKFGRSTLELSKQGKAKSRETLNRLEGKLGYFLPYQFSEMRKDIFFSTIQKMMKEEDIRTALLVGASNEEGCTKAFLAGVLENPNKPTAFCVNVSTPQFAKLKKSYVNNSNVKCYQVLSTSSGGCLSEIENSIRKIKGENKIDFFDVVLIDGSELVAFDLNEIYEANFLILEDINTFQNYKNQLRLIEDSLYILVDQTPSLRGGYAIFKRLIQ